MAMAISLKLVKDKEHDLHPKKTWDKEKTAFQPENVPVPERNQNALPDGTPRGILVVDDNLVVLKAFEMRLKAEGFNVSTTPNAASVASIAESAKVDVIILDINFPAGGHMDWSGFTIMQWLKRFPELGNIPVIMVTGADSAQHREKALAAGAVALFQKPVKFSELLVAIQQALGTEPKKV